MLDRLNLALRNNIWSKAFGWFYLCLNNGPTYGPSINLRRERQPVAWQVAAQQIQPMHRCPAVMVWRIMTNKWVLMVELFGWSRQPELNDLKVEGQRGHDSTQVKIWLALINNRKHNSINNNEVGNLPKYIAYYKDDRNTCRRIIDYKRIQKMYSHAILSHDDLQMLWLIVNCIWDGIFKLFFLRWFFRSFRGSIDIFMSYLPRLRLRRCQRWIDSAALPHAHLRSTLSTTSSAIPLAVCR